MCSCMQRRRTYFKRQAQMQIGIAHCYLQVQTWSRGLGLDQKTLHALFNKVGQEARIAVARDRLIA